MKKIYFFALSCLLFFAGFGAAFTPGNIVVVRVGTGAAALSSAATAVFLDEYTPGGVLVQSIALPTAVSGTNLRLTNSGTATSEGGLNLSTDRLLLTLTGYDAAPGTANVVATTSTATKRVIGIVDANGIINSETGLTDAYSAGNIRSAFTTNGTAIWTAGTASNAANGPGVRYTTAGLSTSTQLSTTVTNIRNVNIYNGQLYVTTGSGGFIGVNTVGSGTPATAGQTIALLPGFPNASGPSPYAFDMKPTTADTLYVADDMSGIQKWVLNSGTWNLLYNITLSPTGNIGVRGLTVDWKTKPVTIYTTQTNNIIIKIIDNGSDASSTKTSIAGAPTNTGFRGIAFVPGTVLLPVKLLSFTASATNGNTVFNWKTATETSTSRFEIEQSTNGNDFSNMATVAAAGNSAIEKSYSYTGSFSGATTYYRLKMIDLDGKFTTSSIVKVAASKAAFSLGNVYPVPGKNNVTIEWNSNRTGETFIIVTDVSGKTVRNVIVKSATGFNKFVLDVQSFNAGQYFVQLRNGTSQVQTVITKQ